jgi:type IV pilus assembly protein PilW
MRSEDLMKNIMPQRTRGFSLVELMVALALAGLVLLGLSAYFVTSSRSFSETERVSRQIENGRYASALLSEEIRHAGFYGEVGNVVNLPPTSAIAMPTAMPDPCTTTGTSVHDALPLPIQGLDDSDTLSSLWPNCAAVLTDYKSGTDAVVIRRANTTTVAAGAAVANGYYTQVAYCVSADPMFVAAKSGFTLQAKDCTTVNPVRQLHVYIYYIATCSIGTGSGGACVSGNPQIPTLKRAELTAGDNWVITPLVEGIENMQLEYGLDTSGDGDADSYKAKPANVTEWSKVVAVKINLLARNTDPTPGYTDNKTYTLGLDSSGNPNNVVAPGDSYRRHAYKELVRVQNVSQRLEATFP